MSLQADPSHRFQSAQEFQIALLAGLPWALDARELFEPMSSAKLPSLEQDSVPTSARKVGLSEHDQTAVGATGEPIEQDALGDEPTYRMGADET